MKKILIFSLFYYPFASGAEPAVKEITDRIDPSDIEFHMVTLQTDAALPRTEQMGHILIHRIGFKKAGATTKDLGHWPLSWNKFLFQFLATWNAWRLHRTHAYDAIWCIMAQSAGVPSALFKILNPRIPFVLTLQEGNPIPQIERTMRPVWPLFKRAFTSATIVQSISSFLASWARSMGFKGPIEVIHNGANPKDLHEIFSPQEVSEIQKKLEKKPGDVFLINTARLVEQKGYDTVIRALPLLPEHVKLVLVGDGEDEAKLKSLTEELHVSHRAIFVGRVDRSQVTAYRKAADIFVGPSRSEGLGNAFLSAMASRLPVIATQEGGLADFLFDAQRNPDHEPTGWAVDKNSPEQIAQAVTFILSHPDDVSRITTNARNMVLQSYDWDAIAHQMRDSVFARLWQ